MPKARSSVSNVLTTAVAAAIFPLAASADGHTLVDVNSNPFPVLGRTWWNLVSLPPTGIAGYQQSLDDARRKDFTVVEFRAACHSASQDNNPPFDGNGNLPFLKTVSGATYTGTFATSNSDTTNSADFSTPNPAYFDSVVAIIDYCAALGIQCHFFPAYMGFPGTDQGWDLEIQCNGATRMQTYGAYVASRLATRKNVTWMLLGDQGASLTTTQKAGLGGLHTGINLAGRLVSSEGSSPSISTDQTDYGSLITVNAAYAFDGTTATQCRRAYASGLPGILHEGPYDEEGPDGDNFNAAATQPVRRFNWWAILSAIGGYCTGNAYVWRCQTPGNSTDFYLHLNTVGAQDLARLNAFWKSIPFQRLVPSGLGTIGTLVTSGGGTIDTSNYVAAAATPLGDLLVAYVGTGTAGSVTIDMTKLRGTVTARWYDPTNGTYTAIGSFANTGTHAFTTPGNNSAGAADWVLRLDA